MRKRRTLGYQNKVYSFRRSVLLKPWSNPTDNNPTEQTSPIISNQVVSGNITFGHMRFRLTDLAGNTDFTNLYERYKITGVKLKFIPIIGTSRDATTSTVMSPIALAINRSALNLNTDDKTFDQLLENQDVKVMSSMRQFNLYVPYPKFYSPADGITQAQEKGGWLNTKAPAVHHFGVQWAYQSTTTSTSDRTAFRVVATYYVKCANPQ